MSGIRNGLILGALHLALVLSLGGKLLYDRATRPRVWVLSQVYDPDSPIRGRYLNERLSLPVEGFSYREPPAKTYNAWFQNRYWAYWEIRDGKLIAKKEGSGSGGWIYLHENGDGSLVAWTEEPVLVFIPEKANVPSLKPGEELWVEVTMPSKGPPRPIQVGIKKGGAITPLRFE